jgi:alkylation response protein AidB-like acyl-CoA dehydrogenase
VDFTLTPDQLELRAGVRKLCAGRLPISRVRAMEATGGIEPAAWQELEAAGVFNLRHADGLDLGAVEAAVVFEELGRGLIPGPLVGTLLAYGLARGPVAVLSSVGEKGDAVVEYAEVSETLLVLSDDGVSLVALSDLASVRPLPPIDPLTPVGVVAQPLPAGRTVGDRALADRLRAEGTVLTAALLVGLASAVTDLTVSYVRQREQFGRPVGSFQAIKHLMADMVVRSELARSAVYSAAVHLDDESLGDADRAVAAAKVMAGTAAVRNGEAAVQAHGGMGFTWEVDAHLYLRRAWALDQAFGSRDEHAVAMAGFL